MSTKKIIPILLSLIISAVLIGVLLNQIELNELSQTFRRIYWPSILIFIVISLLAAVMRAGRYRLLLKPSVISWKNIMLVTFIRNLFVDLFPARIGSLSYIYLLNRRLQFSFEASASTFIIALIFDFLTLSPFLIVSLLLAGVDAAGIPTSALMVYASLFLLVMVVIFWKLIPLLKLFARAVDLFLKIFQLQSKKWAALLKEKIQVTIRSLQDIYTKRIYGRIMVLSFLIRLAKYGALYFLLFALLHSHGFSLPDLNFFKTILGITGAELSSALPLKGLGGFGTWESAWALTFRMMGFDSQLAVISGIGVHLITNLFEYLIGITSIIFISMPFIKTKARNSQQAHL